MIEYKYKMIIQQYNKKLIKWGQTKQDYGIKSHQLTRIK